MKKNLLRLATFVASLVVCLSASAIDNVLKKTELLNEVTSVEALKEATFMLQNEDARVLYTPSGWDIKVGTILDAVSKNDNGGFYKLENVTIDGADHFLMPVFNIDKSQRTFWAGNQYVNSQPEGGNVIFGLSGTNDQHGQDGLNLAVWDITYEEGKGFAFHCVGRDIYIGSDDAAAHPSTEIKYWRAYTDYIAGYDKAEVEAAYALAIEAVKASDDKAALEAANAAFVADENLDAYGDAVNAAINAINACEAVNAAYANLDAAGAAKAAEVLGKYNAGEYKNIAELRAAYIEAAKAQTTAGAIMTGAIVNPSFELGTLEGWTSTDGGAIANNYNFGYRTGDKFVERWTDGNNGGKLSDGSLMQTVTGLPNGTYKLTAEMQNLEQGNGSANGKGYYLVANSDSTEVAVAGETVEVTTEVTDGTITIAAAIKGCTGNWVCVDNFQLTLVEAAPVIAEKTYTIDVERYPGLGYGVTTVTADLTEALAFLGVEAATTDMLSIVNPDGTEISEYATYDGWFAADGSAMTWGADSKVCVKFFQALSNSQFEICDMNGGDVVGTTYTVKYALKANDKTALYTINVKFVEKPFIYLADYTAKAETTVLKIAAQDAEGNWAAESATEAIAIADITALVGENYVVYGVGAKDGDKETITNQYSCDPHPGFWCLADGTADVWANSTFGVSFYATEGVFKTWTKAAVTEDLSTTFYFVNEETKEYVAYEVVLCAPVAEPEPEIGTVIHTIDFTTLESYPYYVMTAPEGSSFDVIDGALVIENTVEQANFWDLQPFVCDWFSLKAGYDYIVRITMKADTDGSATIGMGTWSASMSKQLEFTAGTEYQKYNVEFPASTVESANNDVHVLFQAGKYVGKVEIAKVEIIEIVPVAIESVETAAPAAQKNGKYMENGKLVIIKNGVKYNIAGQVIE